MPWCQQGIVRLCQATWPKYHIRLSPGRYYSRHEQAKPASIWPGNRRKTPPLSARMAYARSACCQPARVSSWYLLWALAPRAYRDPPPQGKLADLLSWLQSQICWEIVMHCIDPEIQDCKLLDCKERGCKLKEANRAVFGSGWPFDGKPKKLSVVPPSRALGNARPTGPGVLSPTPRRGRPFE